MQSEQSLDYRISLASYKRYLLYVFASEAFVNGTLNYLCVHGLKKSSRHKKKQELYGHGHPK